MINRIILDQETSIISLAVSMAFGGLASYAAIKSIADKIYRAITGNLIVDTLFSVETRLEINVVSVYVIYIIYNIYMYIIVQIENLIDDVYVVVF